MCSCLTINSSFAEQFQSTKEQKIQLVKKYESFPSQLATWVGSLRSQALGWSTARSTATLQQLICPGCCYWTSVPHDTPLNPLQEGHSHFPHFCIPFPKLHPDTTERERLGMCPIKGTVNILLDLRCSGVEGSVERHRSYCPHSHGAVREKCVVTDLWHCYLTWKSAVHP